VGSSLGGFLAQKFAERYHKQGIVASLVLCNSFADTTIFNDKIGASVYWAVPAFMLKRMLMSGFPQRAVEVGVADSIDFVVERLETLAQRDLAARMTLNTSPGYVEPQYLSEIPITIIDVFDECAISRDHQDEMFKMYPQARPAHMKSGGNFPYLSHPEEFNMLLKVCSSQMIAMASTQNTHQLCDCTDPSPRCSWRCRRFGQISDPGKGPCCIDHG
jgi:maspardin